MNAFDRVDLPLGTIPVTTDELAKIDAAATARGASQEAVIRLILRTGIRSLPEAPR